MAAKSDSPIKQTFMKLLSPSKSKPPPPILSPQVPPEQPNWTYPESTSSSNFSSQSNIEPTGWGVIDSPEMPIRTANKENFQITNKDVVDRIMGPASKLSKKQAKSKNQKTSKLQDADLDRQFEELMNSRSIPSELRCKLRSVDASVKKHMLKNHSSLSHSPTKSSPSKLFKHKSSVDLLASPKKAKHYSTIAVSPSPVKVHSATVFTEGKVWDVEMQSVSDVRAYFCGINVHDIDVGMVKKLWQLLRNESILWIEQFLKEDGFGMVMNILKDILAIEWRDEKDDALLHQILLCLKALSTTESGLLELSSASSTLFPLIINNLFSDKQPTEFSTRVLIPTLLLSHLTANPTPEVCSTVLNYLADPTPDTKPHDFFIESHTPRPYKKWFAEINSVCRDTFWIFLHPKNVISLTAPNDAPFPLSAKIIAQVPAGFKGGVEWCSAEYLTQHIAVLNAVLAGLRVRDRNQVRRNLRNCGFESLMGGKLRKASQEYYPGLHSELQRWCWEGHRDGWKVYDVAKGFERYEEENVGEGSR